MRVELAPPRQVILSDRDLVADADIDLVVQYVDRTTRDVVDDEPAAAARHADEAAAALAARRRSKPR